MFAKAKELYGVKDNIMNNEHIDALLEQQKKQTAKEIIEMIERRRQAVYEEIKEIKNIHSPEVDNDIGELDGFQYLKNEIVEHYGLDLE